MIRIRPRPDEPKTLRSDKVHKIKEKIARQIATDSKVQSEDFSPYWLENDVRGVLHSHQYGKCCYCERKRELKRESDLEHYRPKARVAEEADHPGYWWLAYDWSNYLIACKPCNEAHKEDHFPLLNGGRRTFSPTDNISEENPVLINPYEENPEDYIAYVWEESGNFLVKAVGKDDEDRGSKTIRLMQLNRTELLDDRAEALEGLDALATMMKVAEQKGNRRMIDRIAKKIKQATASKRSFAGFKRAFFRLNMLSEYIATD